MKTKSQPNSLLGSSITRPIRRLRPSPNKSNRTREVFVPFCFTEHERQKLELEFGDGLRNSLSTAVSALRQVVLCLVSAGTTRKHLMEIGAARGHKPAYVRAVISQILVSVHGGRKRKPGAGPKTPKLAFEILAFARGLVGDKAHKLLLAASHLARIEDKRGAVAAEDQHDRGNCSFIDGATSTPAISKNPLSLIYKS